VKPPKQYDLTYLSLGAGVQSSALLVMSCLGLHGCPRADVAIFADTQAEPQYVYDYLETLKDFAAPHGIDVVVTTAGNLMRHTIDRHRSKRKRFACIPAWTETSTGKAGPLRRQCTKDYKIVPIEKYVRMHLGYQPRQRVKEHVRCMIGISTDEATRIKPSRTRWIENAWPLIDARMDRQDCRRLVVESGLPMPKKSACVFCPFHGNDEWRELRNNYPDEWEKAVEFDKGIRDMTSSGLLRPAFLHRSLMPLDEADIEPIDDGQMELWDMECEGMCGV
jgi:hypothetical protein